MQLLKRNEVAELLRVHPHTVRRLIRTGHLTGFIAGKTTRVTVESVEQLVGAPLNLASSGTAAGRSKAEGRWGDGT